MKKYYYTSYLIKDNTKGEPMWDEAIKFFNELGQEGWHIFNIRSAYGGLFVLLERSQEELV
jgi:hypothetical protein